MRILQPLRRQPVALLWGGLAASAIGDQVYIVAIAWIGVAAFGPWAGWLNALGAGCVLVTALFSGPWVDRHRPAAAMVASDAARALVLLLVVAAWGAGLPLPVWAGVLLLAVAVLGVGQGVFRPALQDVMPATVADPALLPAANALFDSTERIARLVGPGLVGLLSSVLPPVYFLLLDAATFVVSALCINRIASAQPPPAHPSRGVTAQAVLQGYRAVRRHRVLGWQVLTIGPINGAWNATYFLALPLMIERFGLRLGSDIPATASGLVASGPGASGLGAYGLVLLAYGCTNLTANLIVGSRDMPIRPARQIALGNACLGTGLVAMGLTAFLDVTPGLRLGCLVVAALVGAIGGPLQDIPNAVMRQADLPRADVPAGMRAFMVSSQGGTLVALAIAPALLGVVSLGTFIAGCGALVLLMAAATILHDLRP